MSSDVTCSRRAPGLTGSQTCALRWRGPLQSERVRNAAASGFPSELPGLLESADPSHRRFGGGPLLQAWAAGTAGAPRCPRLRSAAGLGVRRGLGLQDLAGRGQRPAQVLPTTARNLVN